MLPTFSLSSCCAFPHMRWQLALSFVFSPSFGTFPSNFRLQYQPLCTQWLPGWELSCWPVTCQKKGSTTVRPQYPFDVKENSKSPWTKGVQLMGAFKIFQHETLFGTNQQINPGVAGEMFMRLRFGEAKIRIPRRSNQEKQVWIPDSGIKNQRKQETNKCCSHL